MYSPHNGFRVVELYHAFAYCAAESVIISGALRKNFVYIMGLN